MTKAIENKITTLERLEEMANDLRVKGRTIVTTNGCFDLLHRGHIETLLEAKSQGDFLCVGINSDESVKRLKGPTRPINNELDRAYCLAALECVDSVFIFDDATPVRWLENLRPHVHVKGSDYQDQKIPEEIIKEWGGRLHFTKFIDGLSTTRILQQTIELHE